MATTVIKLKFSFINSTTGANFRPFLCMVFSYRLIATFLQPVFFENAALPSPTKSKNPTVLDQGKLGFLVEISFTPLLYHPGGFLGVQRSGQAQGTICLLGPLFFSLNKMTFKNLQKSSKSIEKLLLFWDIFRVCSTLAGKQ